MGICSSYESTAVTTAKLILQDGRLKEFSYPVKVSYVLQRVTDPAAFICNSDDMDFDGVVDPISGDKELIPGQLYFALPLNRLKRRLQADEMAALAVKASSALMKSASGKCGCEPKQLLDGHTGRTDSSSVALRKAAEEAAMGSGKDGRVDRGGSRRRSREKFSMILSAISE
ncbi:hypothetical protein SAY86_020016 [Trapa natans]|uniref:Uncharacterized protein n=1 Tax=Trapa natans TaxID=22666 RepID=A0AAN7LLU7_TRANT|nr:hypothetical protein SAY86_020016 [Trapa natans]